MQVWDGQRERSDRAVVSARGVQLQGLDFRFVAETVTKPTDWCFQEPHHVFVIHRRGNLTSMEIDFQSGPSGRCLPRVGDVWVIPAEHRYAALAQGAMVSFCEIAVPTEVFGDRELIPRVGYADILLHRLVERLAGLIHQDGAAATLFRQSLAETVQLHIAEHYPAQPRPTRPANVEHDLDQRAQQIVIDYLHSELDSRIDLDELAATVDMTASRFLSAFAAAFGTTPHQYLIEQRIARAKALLSATAASITDISMSVGFSTPSHFATTFKQRVGVTPTVYRNNS
ncbi:helix-turn-helix transcriptional regulator [Mycolicibacterium komossense]|uniref:Helix-turn-helix transcriptional regulator n=1 Tax=Mycolicibacterium komossense TaxID=1779 RepID=A0ABT3CEY7_9MYCO|nr:AraC family transcriptional regulator [Mycolicibacterium komossense]MCV7228059.1 helix-turn-helix transcriptional regulator [Mycolicibacterium komossense]